MRIKIKVKCVGCENEQEIIGGEIPKDEQPICQKCFMPMIAIKAELKIK